MGTHEFDNRAENAESSHENKFSTMLTELMKNDSLRQPSQADSTATLTKHGFPQLDLIGDDLPQAKADAPVAFKSTYETGNEFTSERELKQAGLNPKDVHHSTTKEAGGTKETTSVKYPNGIEVTVTGHQGKDGEALEPVPQIKEPLPKGFHKDKDGQIVDGHNQTVAQINEDGTVSVKVGKQWLKQTPAGVQEDTVVESHHGSGPVRHVPVQD
ncbi:MAG: hypothetical protein ACRD3W_05700 [Terriglobales bacterium]